jgi:hypothetical protein
MKMCGCLPHTARIQNPKIPRWLPKSPFFSSSKTPKCLKLKMEKCYQNSASQVSKTPDNFVTLGRKNQIPICTPNLTENNNISKTHGKCTERRTSQNTQFQTKQCKKNATTATTFIFSSSSWDLPHFTPTAPILHTQKKQTKRAGGDYLPPTKVLGEEWERKT